MMQGKPQIPGSTLTRVKGCPSDFGFSIQSTQK
jgi:hypothetical protein